MNNKEQIHNILNGNPNVSTKTENELLSNLIQIINNDLENDNEFCVPNGDLNKMLILDYESLSTEEKNIIVDDIINSMTNK